METQKRGGLSMKHFSSHVGQLNSINAAFLQKLLSEQEIIDLSSMLLTNGIHYLPVKTMAQGRALLDTFLTTLNCYQTPSFITTEQLPPHASYINVAAAMEKKGHETIDASALIDFIYTTVYSDFLWIEVMTKMQNIAWLEELEEKIFALHLNEAMPIVVLYEKTN